jgi:FKBP-type peptidyl-prolyl cis-trans isomerase FkpA
MLHEMKARWSPLVLAVALVLPGCRRPEAPKPNLELKTDDDKAFYALGLDIGRNISVFALQPSELELVKLGLSDAVTQTAPKVDFETVRPQLMELARKRSEVKSEADKVKGKAAVESAAKEAGAQQLPSGVVIKSLRPGTGASPTEADTVKVHYEGRLVDGTVFDSSYKRNEPASFPLQGVVPCWTQGLQKLKVGEKAQLTCPSDVAYGDQGRPPTIPGGATLVFDVELLEITGK